MKFICTKCGKIVPTRYGYWESLVREIEPQCSKCLHDEIIHQDLPSIKKILNYITPLNLSFNTNEIMNYHYMEKGFILDIIIFNKYFPDNKVTYFKSKFNNSEKTTIIKSNYKKHFDLIINKKALLSIREWSGFPNKSKMNHISTILNPKIQKIIFHQRKGFVPELLFKNHILTEEDIVLLAENNGYTYDQFIKYFKLDQESIITKKYSHAILHLKNYNYKYIDKLIYEEC